MTVDVQGRSWVLVSGDIGRTGGMDRANLALAHYLAPRVEDLHLVAHAVDEDLLGFPSVRVHRVPRPVGAHLLGSVLLARVGERVARTVCARAPGTRVVVNGGNCRWPDVSWVHCVHHAYELPTGLRGLRRLKAAYALRRSRRRERDVLRRCRLVLANSEQTRAAVTALGVAPERIERVYLACEAERFRPPSADERAQARLRLGLPADRSMAAFVGVLGSNDLKGFDVLIEAWRLLSSSGGRPPQLVVAGGGQVARWRAHARAIGLGDDVRFLGRVDDVRVVLSAADLLVHPTRYDAYGLSVHEALCNGLPVIVSRRAGVSERLGGALAELVVSDPEDPAELVRRVRQALADLERYAGAARALGAQLRERSWESVAAELVSKIEAARPLR